MWKTIILVVIAGIITFGVWCYWYLTTHGFSAREQPSTLEALLARSARRLATPREATNISNPVPRISENIAEARDHFADHCAICHGNDGSGKTQINSGFCTRQRPICGMREPRI